MIFSTYQLGDIDNGGFELSKKAEEALLKLVAGKLDVLYEVDTSKGKNPRYDGWLGGKKVEIKFSAKMFGDELRFANFFETHYKCGKPSALLLTQSLYYLTCTPGWSSNNKKVVGKIRLWKVEDLLKGLIKYPIVKFDYGEYGFYVPNKSDFVPHRWLGDVDCNIDNQEYNLEKFI